VIKKLDVENIVIGDIVMLKSGDRVPADMRIGIVIRTGVFKF